MNKLRYLGLSLLLLTTSCDDFVKVPLPNSQLTGATVFESDLTAKGAMAQVYVQLRDSGMLTGFTTGASLNMGLYADELQDYSTSVFSQPVYRNNLTPDNGTVLSLWQVSYSQVYKINAIIAGLENATGVTEPVRNQLWGEALFLRALVHFYLLQVYGAIPYVTTTDYTINRQVPRQDADAIYSHIVADLTESVPLIAEDYISEDRARPNRFAVRAFLARVYLYMGRNAEAANEASAVLNSGLYTWETDLNRVFLRNSTTTIWQFAAASEGGNTNEGNSFIFLSGPPPLCALRADFMASFAPGDQRKVHWTKAVTNGTNTWFHPYKYKLRTVTGTSQEYSILFRLAEQYLIRAEARAKQGELSAAKDDLDVIRTTAGLSPTTAVTQTALLEEISRQRRFELFTEYGHRFFDLKRSGTIDAVLGISKPGWNPTDALWPIPQSELDTNPNLLPQNPGY